MQTKNVNFFEAPKHWKKPQAIEYAKKNGIRYKIKDEVLLLERKYVASHFAIEDGPIYAGWMQLMNDWNGWMQPYFTKETAMQFLATEFANGLAKFVNENIELTHEDYPEDEPAIIEKCEINVDGNNITAYYFNNGFIWSESKCKEGFIVVLNLASGSCQPIFREDENLMFFDTKESAQAEIDECLQEVKDAVEKGDMSNEYSQDDYSVIPAMLADDWNIHCTIDGVKYQCHLKDEDFTQR